MAEGFQQPQQFPKPFTYAPNEKVLIFCNNDWHEGEIVGAVREYRGRRGRPNSRLGTNRERAATAEYEQKAAADENVEEVERYSAIVGTRRFPKLGLDRIRPRE